MKDYLLTLLVTAAVTYVLTPLVRRFAIAVGAINAPRERDVHVAPVPSVGGLAMYAGLAAGLLVAEQIPQLRDAIANTGMVTGLLGAGGLLVLIGFIDDRWGMNAITKAAGQVAAGGIVVATGAQLSWLPLPGGSGRIFIPSPDQQALLTIIVIVATINAVNFIDGLDGLAAGIVAIAAISFFAYYYSLTKLIAISSLAAPALASAVLIGMCLGFLPHNFSPARIFMGDTGSMLLGLLLAYAPISSINSLPTAELEYSINRYPVIMPLLLPALLLVIPYGDLLLAVVRRTRAGQSPFAPDRKHLHHRLLDIGHSQRASVLIMYLWAAAFSGSVVWLSIDKTERPRATNHHGEPLIVFVVVTIIAVAILLLLSMPWQRWWERRARRSGAAREPAGLAGAALQIAAAARGRRDDDPAEPVAGLAARPDSQLATAAAPARSATSWPAGPLATTGGPASRAAEPGVTDSPANGESGPHTGDWSGAGSPANGATAGSHPRTEPGQADSWPAEDGSAGAPPAPSRPGNGYHSEAGPADLPRDGGGSRFVYVAEPGGDGLWRSEVHASRQDRDAGRSVVGSVPPAVSGGEWAWFRPSGGGPERGPMSDGGSDS